MGSHLSYRALTLGRKRIMMCRTVHSGSLRVGSCIMVLEYSSSSSSYLICCQCLSMAAQIKKYDDHSYPKTWTQGGDHVLVLFWCTFKRTDLLSPSSGYSPSGTVLLHDFDIAGVGRKQVRLGLPYMVGLYICYMHIYMHIFTPYIILISADIWPFHRSIYLSMVFFVLLCRVAKTGFYV
jgi:hypothetical protein